jgi:hypothetical protein
MYDRVQSSYIKQLKRTLTEQNKVVHDQQRVIDYYQAKDGERA